MRWIRSTELTKRACAEALVPKRPQAMQIVKALGRITAELVLVLLTLARVLEGHCARVAKEMIHLKDIYTLQKEICPAPLRSSAL